MQTLEIIDLGICNSKEEVHNAFKKTLGFPSFYGRNWDAMWDTITGLIEMPTNLILYNFSHFEKVSKPDADILLQLIKDYNEEFSGTSIIQFDYMEGLEKGLIETIFKNRPSQYGFRGDIHLWDDLETSFVKEPMPYTEEELIERIRRKIKELTGSSTLEKKDFYVHAYNIVGMSGGRISWEFWETLGLPMLIGRYRMLKGMG